MKKICLWQQNEPLFHSKLNEEVKAINCLIGKTTTEASNNSFSNGNSSIAFPQFQTTKHELAKMFEYDGEAVVLNGWKSYFVGAGGLYARKNGVQGANGQNLFFDTNLQLLALNAELSENKHLYQEIIIDKNNGIEESNLFLGEANNLKSEMWNDKNEKAFLRRRLSRIARDCKVYSCGANSRDAFVAIGTNDAFLLPIAGTRAVDCGMKKGEAMKKQTASLFAGYCGMLANIKGLKNCGGFRMWNACGSKKEQTKDFVALQSGIEIYRVKECGAGVLVEPTLNKCSPIPKNLEATIACWKVFKQTYCWNSQTNSWDKQNRTEQTNLNLQTKKVSCNNWQIGFASTGEIEVPEYIPPTTQQQQQIIYEVTESKCCGNIAKVCTKTEAGKVIYEIFAGYEFDPEFFTVTQCGATAKVALNEAAFETIAREVANELSVSVVGCGIVEPTFLGQVVVTTNGSLTLNSVASTRRS